MRPLLLLPLAIIAAPAAAQLPISGIGNAGGRELAQMHRRLGDRPDRVRADHRRSVELVGQIGRLERRIRQMRENGEITRAEARRMRRETRHMVSAYLSSSRNGLSDFEAGMLQSRVSAFSSVTSRPRVPTGR